jgi:putative colanic acid biosynthesis UDP-glucose lipid carrier transferase
MFRLEKIFQNNDKTYINFLFFFKIILIYLSIYIFAILENNSFFDLLNYEIYYKSVYLNISFYFTIIYFLIDFFLIKKFKFFFEYGSKFYKNNFIILSITSFLTLILINLFHKMNINYFNFFYLFLFIVFNILLMNFFSKKIYNFLIEKNIIQRNILLVGFYKNILNFIKEDRNNINIYKCCIIFDKQNLDFKSIRNEFKIPVFTSKDDIRSILEYHALGQIWVLDDKNFNINNILDHVIKFSVDILILDISKKLDKNKSLINSRYNFLEYEISKFHGSNLFIKILIDKILSLIFLLVLSPILIVSFLAIYLEDGLPIFFTQDRTGWDGRRFKIYKIRSLKNLKFDKTDQVQKNDNRLLKIGKFIRRFSIDEVPQFFNVLLGDMSIVGPRPHMVEHDIYYSGFFKEFLKRHKTNPGLTGWAQVNGLRGATPTPEIMKKRMELDLWYLNNWTPMLDLWIIFKTFYVIFKHKGV